MNAETLDRTSLTPSPASDFVVCPDLARLTREAGAGEITAPAFFVAIVASFLSLYGGRDRVRIAVRAGAEPAPPGERMAVALRVIELSPSAGTTFIGFAQAAGRALKDAATVGFVVPEAGPPAEALVHWNAEDITRPTTTLPDIDGRVEFMFRFIHSGDNVQLEVRTAPLTAQRISAASVVEAILGTVSCVSENTGVPLEEIAWVSQDCGAKLLAQLSGPAVAYERDRTILRLFEDRVAQAGERPAVTFGELTLSYAELDGKANALAGLLHKAGIRCGELVPLVIAGGLELPIAMLAVMKLGAAFVPIDPTWPGERLRVIFGELNPQVALYNDESQRRVFSVECLCVAASSIQGTPLLAVGVRPRAQDLIYGFFTSGSTGVPKCALNFHTGLLNRFLAMSRRFGADGSEVVLQNSRAVFDSSIWQLLWPLTTGGQVVIPAAGKLMDLGYTISLIERHRVTMTDFVPSIFNALVDLIEADGAILRHLDSLRQLLIGGEEIGARAVQKFRSWLRGCKITNTYGPTEASIGCVFHEVRDEDGAAIPIGRPIDNCWAAIVDARGRLVPPGIIGELLIGGDCLGQGYLNDKAKTDAAFISNSLPGRAGARLYRTGDLCYCRPDGNLSFVGRQDHQVKLGGVRIELNEIESVISGHPAVRAVKVIVAGHREESQRLVAYVVAHTGTGPTDIQRAVARSLPAYCVPKQVFLIDRMPLNANGKVDRQALAALGHLPERSAAWIGTDLQRRIRALWLELLALDSAGLEDDFFTLGGDSLVAVRLSLRLRKEFGCQMSARDIYQYPTISGQASFLMSRLECGEAQQSTSLTQTLIADTHLDSGIHIESGALSGTPRVVLLTGATGFIGSHLLHSLLRDTSVHVLCLIRAADDATAAARLRQTFLHYRLHHDKCLERTTAIAGDLAVARLGVSDAAYERLARSVDSIVHSGADVNFLLGYAALKHTNVSGTLEIIRLAAQGSPKTIHYISTLAAVAANGCGPFAETELTAGQPFPAFGYGQSKAVAERLIAQACARGLPTVTYRLGEVMPHSRLGIANTRALLDTLIRCCLKLGLCFASSLRVDYTPVDYVARFLAAAVTAPALAGRVFHVFHPQGGPPLDKIFSSFRNAGFRLRPVAYAEFHEVLRDCCAVPGADPDLLLTLGLIPDPRDSHSAGSAAKLSEIVDDATLRFSCAQTLATLNTLGISWPTPGQDALDCYARSCRHRVGGECEMVADPPMTSRALP